MKRTLMVVTAFAVLALAVPAAAEDFYVGTPGVGVEIGGPGYHRDRYRDDWRSHHYRTEGYDRYYGAERCRTTIIRHSDGSTTRERRCRD